MKKIFSSKKSEEEAVEKPQLNSNFMGKDSLIRFYPKKVRKEILSCRISPRK